MALLLVLLLPGCASVENGNPLPRNPSFDVNYAEARAMLAADAAHPRPLQRPLLIVGGFLDPGVAPASLANQFRQLSGDPRITTSVLAFCFDFDQCRRRIVKDVDAAFPTDDPQQTTEVDVIAVSMGGVAARYAAAALPPDPGHRTPPRRLRIARLFTISSPLRGAALADEVPSTIERLDPVAVDMRTGSDFSHRLEKLLESTPQAYPIYSYVRLRDLSVGAVNAAVEGQTPWWLPLPPFALSHGSCFKDPRILADVDRRLRGQPPLATDPPSPVPTRQQ